MQHAMQAVTSLARTSTAAKRPQHMSLAEIDAALLTIQRRERALRAIERKIIEQDMEDIDRAIELNAARNAMRLQWACAA
jgi:hypothetical protein